MIGERDGVHAGLFCARHHLVDLGEPVEQGIMGMRMKWVNLGMIVLVLAPASEDAEH